jgi:hypothetical protein
VHVLPLPRRACSCARCRALRAARRRRRALLRRPARAARPRAARRGAALDPRRGVRNTSAAMVLLTEHEGQSLVSDRRLILFSVYFDAKKTLAQGRKVPASLACANPNFRDVADCLDMLKLPWELQARPSRAVSVSLPVAVQRAGRPARACGARG